MCVCVSVCSYAFITRQKCVFLSTIRHVAHLFHSSSQSIHISKTHSYTPHTHTIGPRANKKNRIRNSIKQFRNLKSINKATARTLTIYRYSNLNGKTKLKRNMGERERAKKITLHGNANSLIFFLFISYSKRCSNAVCVDILCMRFIVCMCGI